MGSSWLSRQDVDAHLVRVATWDAPGKYRPRPWHLFKELGCSWDGKGFMFQFRVLNCGGEDMQVLVRADPAGRVAHTITTNGLRNASKSGAAGKGTAKGSQGSSSSQGHSKTNWSSSDYTSLGWNANISNKPADWGDSWKQGGW